MDYHIPNLLHHDHCACLENIRQNISNESGVLVCVDEHVKDSDYIFKI